VTTWRQSLERTSPAAKMPGTLVRMEGKALIAACGTGAYRITALRPAGKNTMGAADFYNGRLKGLAEPFGMLSSLDR